MQIREQPYALVSKCTLTHSRLQWRKGDLELWSDEGQRFMLDMHLLISTGNKLRKGGQKREVESEKEEGKRRRMRRVKERM